MPSSKTIFLGIKGSVIALDPATGRPLWTVHLRGSSFVNVVLDGDKLYAATQGEVYCLDPATGAERWHNELKGYGRGLVTIASETMTPGTLLTLMEQIQRDESAAAGAAAAGSATVVST